MKQLPKNLYVGNGADCFRAICDNYAVVHVCKTCHQRHLKYKGSLPKTHPNYLIKEIDAHLFLNLVDSPKQEDKYVRPMINVFLKFMEKYKGTNILIHCDQGESRSPALALLYLAKIGILPKDSYLSAKKEFLKLYPNYYPKGIEGYLINNWKSYLNGQDL